jgi:hypothetical protein
MGMAKLSPEVKAARAERKKRKAPRIADWLAIRALYLGGMKSEELGQKFGVTGNLIRARAHDERWFETALEQTPRMVVDKIMKQEAEATGAMLTEIWAERGRLIREKEFRIAEKAASHAEMMDDTTLLNKIDKVKVAIDMGRRSTGLDKVESNPNAVNIAVLGDIGMFENEANAFKKAKPVQPD